MIGFGFENDLSNAKKIGSMLYKNCLHVKAKAKKDGETGGRYFAAHAVVQTQQTESCTVARNGCCNYYYSL